jgi:hypothetical protein
MSKLNVCIKYKDILKNILYKYIDFVLKELKVLEMYEY